MVGYLAAFVKIDEAKLQNMAHSVIATALVPASINPSSTPPPSTGSSIRRSQRGSSC
jgi:hypothetical protein